MARDIETALLTSPLLLGMTTALERIDRVETKIEAQARLKWCRAPFRCRSILFGPRYIKPSFLPAKRLRLSPSSHTHDLLRTFHVRETR
jgi:hypothetical protein